MPELFVSSRAAARAPGAYAIEATTPRFIGPVALGRIGLACQAPWGPLDGYEVSGASDMLRFWPAGSPRTDTGWLAVTGRNRGAWTISRVVGGSAGILPPNPPTIAQVGAAGVTTYTYSIVPINANGDSIGSAVGITTTGNATLDGTNYNVLTWSAVTGATSYDVYRVSGGATQGMIVNTASTTYNDQGAAGDSSSPPTINASGYSYALCNLLDANGVAVARIVTKYVGEIGNDFTAAVAAATDGTADKFDITFTVTDTVTGATTETYQNFQVTGTPVLLTTSQLNASLLIGSMAVIGTPGARPANGSYTFTGGSEGSAIVAADYTSAIADLSTFDVAVICADDCGDSLRTTVNNNLRTQAATKQDRLALLTHNRADAWATVKGNSGNGVGAHRDKNSLFFGWCKVADVNQVDAVSPACTFAAVAITQQEPQQSHAWHRTETTAFYLGITDLYREVFSPQDDTIQGEATDLGVCLLIRAPESGRFVFLHDRTTSLAVNERFAITRRIKQYWARAFNADFSFEVNGPNVLESWRQMKLKAARFLEGEFAAGRIAANIATGAPLYNEPDIVTQNTQESVAAGEFAMVIEATTPSAMEKIFTILRADPTVVLADI